MALLRVALQVKCGDDINFTFRSELPKLFSHPPLKVPPQYQEDYDVQRYVHTYVRTYAYKHFGQSTRPVWTV